MILPTSSPKRLRSVSEKRLVLYGVAAGAALAAGVSPAEADLITLDLTSLATTARTSPSGPGSLYFQVNAATPALAVATHPFSTANFRLYRTQTKLGSGAHINGVLPNNSIAVGGPSNKAARFSGSNSVGSANNFAPQALIGSTFIKKSFGNFQPGDTGYLGLKFTIGPDLFFGWANITVNSNYTVTLNTLGYEDSGRPAHVPLSVPDQGSSILLLAIGAAGIAAFRGLQRKAA
jgi:hypothetical protein